MNTIYAIFKSRNTLYICKGNENRILKGDKIMAYKMVTLNSYIESLEDKNVVSLNDKSIELKVEKYILNLKRAESNAKIIEALLA